MTAVSLNEIHDDLEVLKRDMAELKAAMLGDEGELTDWAKQRIENYLKKGTHKIISQKEIEKRFL